MKDPLPEARVAGGPGRPVGDVERFAVYMMTNKPRGTLYTGVTNDLEARYSEHRSGAVPGFTKKYNLHRLVHAEFFDSIDQAIEHEKRLKGWLRARKIALIESTNPEWIDLGEEWFQVTEAE